MSQILLSIGTWASGTIDGAVATSVITSSGLPPGLTIDSATRTWSYNGVGPVATGTLSLIETKAGATGSPYTTSIGYSVVTPSTLSAPVLTKTSASGAALEWDIALAADIYEGYYLFSETSADGVTKLDGTYTTPTQVVSHVITPADYASGTISNADLAVDGYVDQSGLVYLHAYVYRDDGTTSLISNQISDTVTASVAKFATTPSFDKSNNLTLTNANLTATANTNTNALQSARVVPAITGQRHIEFKIASLSAAGASPQGDISVGVCGEVQDMSTSLASQPGATGTQGATATFKWNSATVIITRDGATQSVVLTGSVLPAIGDIIVVEFDTAANSVSWKYIPLATGTPQTLLTRTLTGTIPATWHAFAGCWRLFSGADGITMNASGAGPTPWALTPASGYAGW